MRLVEKEVWVGRTIAAIAPVREQPLAQARALDRLQVLLGNDLVGIHVHPVERGDEASEYGESIHRVSPLTGPHPNPLPLCGRGDSLSLPERGRVRYQHAFYPQFLISTKCPSTAAATAMAGDTRWVRPPLPWRPSKLRLLVEAQRSPGWSTSAFIPRHIEHPGSRHSKPASLKTLSRPSSSACFFTRPEPGTTIARTVGATFLPLA